MLQSKSVAGVVLWVALVFLSLFSLLGNYALMHAARMLKTTQQAWQRKMQINYAEQLLSDIEAKVMRGEETCHISITSSATLVRQPLAWWQSQACWGGVMQQTYYYVVESLALDPCARLSEYDSSIAQYERITLRLSAIHSDPSPRFLQSVVVIAANSTGDCLDSTHLVKKGRQSRRIL